MTDLDGLEKLLAAATQGPFTISVTEENDVRVMAHDAEDPNNPWHFCTVEWDCDEASPLENAAAAIVALHNAAPGLIADNRRLAERVRVLERALDECDRARIMIGAKLDSVSEVQKEAAINEAWHVLQRAITKADARKALEASHDQ